MTNSHELRFVGNASATANDVFSLDGDVVADAKETDNSIHSHVHGSLINFGALVRSSDPPSPLASDSTSGESVEISSGGTFGPLIIWGTNDADEIHAYDTNYLIYGYGGDDRIFTGGAPDEVHGGSGYDYIKGGGGDDTLYAGADGGSLWGEDGNDTLYAGNDGASLWGGADSDTLRGGDGRDTLSGDDGNDTLAGFEGRDSLSGGPGNDSLLGGVGADNLTGGSGSDQFSFLWADTGNYTEGQADIISDFENSDTIYIATPDTGLYDAGSTRTPAEGHYSIFQDSSIDAWIIRMNVGGYHDIVVHGDDPHGNIGWLLL